MYTEEQIDKIGNSIIFLASHIPEIGKTKLLKLLYLLDEFSIKKSGIPFLNLEYKVWKFGPVASDIFVELSSKPSILQGYITREVTKDGHNFIAPQKEFNDDEFSGNELGLLQFVVDKFKNATTEELVALTHRKESPWYNAAKKNDVYELLEAEKMSSTDIKINMKELIAYDERKMRIYEDYLAHY